MRGIILAVWLVPAIGFAGGSKEDIRLRGWTDAGDAVIEVHDGAQVIDDLHSITQSDTDQSDYWAVCSPEPVGAELTAGNGVCSVCKDAASCGVTTVVKHPAPAKISPDHQIRVKDRKVCTGKGDAKKCQRVVTLGKLDTLTHDQDANHDKLGASRVYFRPDSGAVMVVFEDDVRDQGKPIQKYTPYFVNLTAAFGRGPGDDREYGGSSGGGTASGDAKHDGYAFALKSSGDLVLQVTSGGNMTETQIDHLSNPGAAMTIDRMSGKVTGGATDAKAIVKNLPDNTVVAEGFELGGGKFVVAAAVQDTHGVSVVEQQWTDGADAPSSARTIKIP